MTASKIDQATKKTIHLLLSQARTRELIYTESALHSAYLAAFQVHGKRIEFLESRKDKPKQDEFSLEDIILDVLVDLVVSGVAGKVIKAGMEALIRPIVRSRQAYYAIPKIKVKKKKIKIIGANLNAEQIREARKKTKKKLKEHFNRVANFEDSQAYTFLPELIVGSTLEVASDDARSAINVPKRGSRSKGGTAGQGQTAVVEFLLGTLASYNVQKNAIEGMYANLEAELLYAEINTDTGKEWQGFLNENTTPRFSDLASVTEFTERLVLWYEMSMWAYTFDVTALSHEEVGRGSSGTGLNREQTLASKYNNPKNYEIHEESDSKVVYTMPEATRDEVRQVKKTVAISKDLLNYWINSFPRDFDIYPGPTIFEHFDKLYGFSMGDKNRINRTRINAYEGALGEMRIVRRKMKEGKRKIKTAQKRAQ